MVFLKKCLTKGDWVTNSTHEGSDLQQWHKKLLKTKSISELHKPVQQKKPPNSKPYESVGFFLYLTIFIRHSDILLVNELLHSLIPIESLTQPFSEMRCYFSLKPKNLNSSNILRKTIHNCPGSETISRELLYLFQCTGGRGMKAFSLAASLWVPLPPLTCTKAEF